ncbi:MAG: elongation factor 4 [Candidatus Yanofskybacteria bacterium RIFCSPHIGHO2_01_FULL_43_42]|uniref:Elongation factor 4 n=1 Tax=Candidatus Yanofskybacteria bacterium RIFCSPLOWO2_01_FULL_43_22 TaxID=1802695 RepID=A0A1F8GHD4_9BACT|nr:MAG: elongation factor 4 [Candidatus Yanofskybacteria bacterium RIFCSPHIGHO2_01_FULL_43_42]OGN13295.1 MAG: elongation factor 4 [Candidatus Yanofskybacteria bacterium RIFCSPHIGHO2_02_FULL_43_17]OGN24711.1 MAG: elongation factor 4 [Candidatus Yanofskybacteria bacterium RIFCSPLOWO2_01_FULL_43_22]
MNNVRNFCIIAHIDHGKSTLADRFLELTGTVEKRKMQEQYLDQMELERERGITIKLQPVRMNYVLGSKAYVLNLIDTPGHVDFSYEVSRSLAAVEGAILLVDASKGIQAQTLANLHLAKTQGLKIIPAVNKIDLPNARTAQVKEELSYLLEIEQDEILEVSGKTGANVEKLLQAVIEKVPSPSANIKYQELDTVESGALIFDSTFDAYKGIIAYVRMFDGAFKRGDKVASWATKAKFDVLEVGFFAPKLTLNSELSAGNIGYIATGLKDPGLIRVGDTITSQLSITDYELRIKNNTQYAIRNTQFKPLSGYKEPKPMVFASFFPENAEDYDLLKDALGKLKLTDASLIYEPESSVGLGRGFRLGFLGMLHVEIISERLKREFDLPLIISTPSVEYLIKLADREEVRIKSASSLPDPSKIESIAEPVVDIEIITPSSYLGSVMELISSFRNTYQATDYFGKETAFLRYEMPLSEVITDFYDKLKSVSSGYASMSYELKGMAVNDLVRLDILIAGELVEPFSRIVPKDKAYYEGRTMAAKLKEVIPPQWFEVAIQAAIGGKIIARESIKAKRKDVTGYLYGGDVTRKMKLLEKQKKGKKKMKEAGRVNLPQEVFLKMLKR